MDLFKNFDDDEDVISPEKEKKFTGKRAATEQLPGHKTKKQRG
jgi:hypothetical protein